MEKREIKFRAWNKKDSNLKDRMIQQATITNNGLVVMPDGDEWDIPLMQYTGLKDKEGKECFEGDKVGSGVVVWQEFDARFVIEGKNWEQPMSFIKRLEVIGNIYENKELLK